MEDKKQDNIKKLYRDFFKGNHDAVLHVVELYREGLILFINGYVHNMSQAEDLASDAFAKLLLKRPFIKNESYFKTYLFSMGKNAALDWLKKNKRLKNLEENHTSVIGNPEEVLFKNEKKRIVLQALDKLLSDYRSVLYLHYFEELSIDDIAKIMKKNKKQIYNLLQRAKTAMREILKEEGISDEID